MLNQFSGGAGGETVTERIAQLDAIVRQFDLNAHPFYRDWRAGTLSVEQLAEYAAEWAPFIAVIDRGWERIGESAYAAEEREHDELWSHFRAALGPRAAASMERPQSRTLLAVGEQAFAEIPETLGALYSFEVQQPATAQSKLAGLREHYAGMVDDTAQTYFQRPRRGDRRARNAGRPHRSPLRRRVRASEDGVRGVQRGCLGSPGRRLLHRVLASARRAGPRAQVCAA